MSLDVWKWIGLSIWGTLCLFYTYVADVLSEILDSTLMPEWLQLVFQILLWVVLLLVGLAYAYRLYKGRK